LIRIFEVGFLQEIDHPSEGKIQQIGLTNQFSNGVRNQFLPAPRLGENTTEILQEFGFTQSEIENAIRLKL
jgi:formyl-CoA transferase